MASQGWENITATDIARMQQGRQAPAGSSAAKPSKYRNVKTVVNGECFDSQREAEHWIALKIREGMGEITNLRRQVAYELYAPTRDADGRFSSLCLCIAKYIADLDYFENGVHIVADVKGGKATRTQVYMLKRKWLERQEGIVIREL